MSRYTSSDRTQRLYVKPHLKTRPSIRHEASKIQINSRVDLKIDNKSTPQRDINLLVGKDPKSTNSNLVTVSTNIQPGDIPNVVSKKRSRNGGNNNNNGLKRLNPEYPFAALRWPVLPNDFDQTNFRLQ